MRSALAAVRLICAGRGARYLLDGDGSGCRGRRAFPGSLKNVPRPCRHRQPSWAAFLALGSFGILPWEGGAQPSG